MKQDYYAVLGVEKTATTDDIKKAYRKAAMQHHPDRHTGDAKVAAEIKFKEINEANECLSDPAKRARYDQFGHQDPSQQPQWSQGVHPAGDINDIFASIFSRGNSPFGDIFGHQYQPRQQQPRHLITISLEDAYVGKQIKLPSDQTINLPAGIRSGTKFVIDSALYIIEVQPHTKFKRSNDDLLVDVEISSIEAILSVNAMITHLDRAILQFTIPAGIQNGQIVRLAGKGMKNPETDRLGDLLIRITITTPRDLKEEQLALLKTLPHRDIFNI
jgi:curved DNA-binding protein